MNKLKISILSISMLTIMAGAAVAPALGAMNEYFENVDPTIVKLIITFPCLFIIIASLSFQKLTSYFNIKTLALIGVSFYVIGGVLGGIATNIYFMFAMRALLGLGVGILMPLSTGLLAYYFDRNEQIKLLGYSSAINNLGGVLATIASGFLAVISWRYAFLVYLLGVVVAFLILFYLPKEKISGNNVKITRKQVKLIRPYMISIFMLMIVFYSVPSNFAIVASSISLAKIQVVGLIMSSTSLTAFFVGLFLVKIFKTFQEKTKIFAFACYVIGFFFLSIMNNIVLASLGLIFIGLAMGSCMPIINSQISKTLDKEMVPAAMSLMSATVYAGQFLSPIVVNSLQKILSITSIYAPFIISGFLSLILFIYILRTPFKI